MKTPLRPHPTCTAVRIIAGSALLTAALSGCIVNPTTPDPAPGGTTTPAPATTPAPERTTATNSTPTDEATLETRATTQTATTDSSATAAPPPQTPDNTATEEQPQPATTDPESPTPTPDNTDSTLTILGTDPAPGIYDCIGPEARLPRGLTLHDNGAFESPIDGDSGIWAYDPDLQAITLDGWLAKLGTMVAEGPAAGQDGPTLVVHDRGEQPARDTAGQWWCQIGLLD